MVLQEINPEAAGEPVRIKLVDMFAMLESCSQNDLTIDDDCLNRYPIEDYDHLYKRIGPLVTKLTVSKVTEEQLELLSLHFQNIQNLNLERILIEDLNLAVVFPNLQCLKLDECVIRPETMSEIHSAANSSLRVHLKKSHIDDRSRALPIVGYYGEIAYGLPEFEHFTHLTLEKMAVPLYNNTHYLNLNGRVRSLRIVDCEKSVTMTRIKGNGNYSKLKCLSLETWESARDFAENISELHLNSLEILTLSHLPMSMDWLRSLRKLKELKILRPIQSYEEVALIEALSAMKNKIDVKYSVHPHPKHNVDEMINALNEDCLREILKYLTLDDIFNLAMMNPQFKDWISMIDVCSLRKTVEIDEKFLFSHPVKQQLIGYEALGHSLSSLCLDCSVDEFITLAPCFPHLQELYVEIHKDWEWNDQVIEVFPTVENLTVGTGVNTTLDAKGMTKLLRKQQPTLRVFHAEFEIDLNKDDFEFVQQLYNLKELYISHHILNEDLKEFWKQNQSLELLHLESGDWSAQENTINQERNWKEIAALESLEVFYFSGFDLDLNETLPPMNYIKKLSYLGACPSMYRPLLISIGSQLEVLSVFLLEYSLDEIIPLISGLKNLKSFEYETEDPLALTAEQIIRWMIEFPKLSEMKINIKYESDPKEFEMINFEHLRQFLSAAKRVLHFNGKKYPQ